MTEEKEKPEKVDDFKDQTKNGEEILDDYAQPRTRQTKFWLWIILAVVFILLVFIYKATVIDTTVKPQDLKASMELFDINSQWVQSEEINTPEFKGIVLVPEISFQVRNNGKKDLYYVYFLGVFRLVNSAKALGEGMYMAFKVPLKPGQESGKIKLTSAFGYRASSKEAFNTNSKEWRNAMVEIFIKSGAGSLFPLKSFYISRKIEGLEIDIKLTNTQPGSVL